VSEQASVADLAAAVATVCDREFGTQQVRHDLTSAGQEVHSVAAAKLLADHGWLGIGIPPEYGGGGGSLTELSAFLEAAWYGKAPIGGYPTSAIVGAWYSRFGSGEQKRTILGGIAAGRVEALALSEPDSGSDVGAARCRARRAEPGYVLTGTKTWCSNVHLADHVLVLARTGGDGVGGLSMFCVPTDTPGIEVRPIPSLAGRELNDLVLTDVRLPTDALVGAEGQGWLQVMSGLVFERLVIASIMLGLARRALDDTVGYVRQRSQFGQPVGSFQSVRHRLADLATEVECCRLLVRDTIGDGTARTVSPHRASMVKLKVTETARRVVLEGSQLMGAAGVAVEYDMERQMRLALLSTIYGGTSEIQRDIVGQSLGL
jgi:alkylation response protein AidB-like acyl-CoA dehydrogenase